MCEDINFEFGSLILLYLEDYLEIRKFSKILKFWKFWFLGKIVYIHICKFNKSIEICFI